MDLVITVHIKENNEWGSIKDSYHGADSGVFVLPAELLQAINTPIKPAHMKTNHTRRAHMFMHVI